MDWGTDTDLAAYNIREYVVQTGQVIINMTVRYSIDISFRDISTKAERTVTCDMTGFGVLIYACSKYAHTNNPRYKDGHKLIMQDLGRLALLDRRISNVDQIVKQALGQNASICTTDNYVKFTFLLGMVLFHPDLFGHQIASKLWFRMPHLLRMMFSAHAGHFMDYRKTMFGDFTRKQIVGSNPKYYNPGRFNIENMFLNAAKEAGIKVESLTNGL